MDPQLTSRFSNLCQLRSSHWHILCHIADTVFQNRIFLLCGIHCFTNTREGRFKIGACIYSSRTKASKSRSRSDRRPGYYFCKSQRPVRNSLNAIRHTVYGTA